MLMAMQLEIDVYDLAMEKINMVRIIVAHLQEV